MANQIALVTGGAGFIGSHLCDALLARELDVRVLDNFSTGRAENVDPRCEIIRADVTDHGALAGAMKGVQVVFHLAARVTIRGSVDCFEEEFAEYCECSHAVGVASGLDALKLIFRAMDIVKPYPARQLESLPRGWGIMADDLMAGVYANLALRVVMLV